jgi:hypothetical protein
MCPLCTGRGWIPASDPAQFPAQCSCRNLEAAPKPEPAPTLTLDQKVGGAVLAACRDAGLIVEWNGSAATRIKLPQFRWQRRIVVPRAADIQDFIESWELELRAGGTSESEIFTDLEERAGDWFAEFTDFGPDLLRRLRDHTEMFVREERAREATWTDPTVNDRIDAAFDELRTRGLFAFQDIATTIQDGWAFVGVNATAGERGAVFFHQEDVIDGVGGLGLNLAFGTFETDPAENEASSLALGSEIVSVLEAHGVAVAWRRSVRDRIRVLPFEWKKRRWTKAPAHLRAPEPASATPEGSETATSVKPTIWARLFGRTSATPRPHEPDTQASRLDLRKRFVERGFSTVVQARRTTAGFDLRLSMKLRAAWQSLGASERGHVCHLGVPHTFVPAGEHTTLAVQSALENIREEAIPLRERGARAVKGRTEPEARS